MQLKILTQKKKQKIPQTSGASKHKRSEIERFSTLDNE